jgi:mono/diheme cytochrome c family protein
MRVRFSRVLVIAVTLFLVSVGGRAVLVGQAPATGGNPEAAKMANPVPATPESIKAGETVFQRNCARCHGANGKGGQPVGSATSANLTDEKWDHGGTDGEIFNTIKNGVAPAYMMEPWEGQISDEAIWQVINYIRTLGPGGAKKSEP